MRNSIRTCIPAFMVIGLLSCSEGKVEDLDRMERSIKENTNSTTFDHSAQEELQQQRNVTLDELRALRADINDDLAEVEVQLATPDQSEESLFHFEQLRSGLMKQHERVENAMEKAENAVLENWYETQAHAQKTLDSANSFYDQQGIDRRRNRNVAIDADLDLNRNAEKVR